MNTWTCTECDNGFPDEAMNFPVGDEARDVCSTCYDSLAERGLIDAGYPVAEYIDPRAAREAETREVARSHGYDHANHVTAYGGDMDATPDVPERYAHLATYYLAAYADGVQDYQDEQAEAEAELELINSTPGNVSAEMAHWYNEDASNDLREAWTDFTEYAGADYVENITPEQFTDEIYQGQQSSLQDFADNLMEDIDDGSWKTAMELLQSRGYHRPDVDEIAWQQDYYMSENGHVFTTSW